MNQLHKDRLRSHRSPTHQKEFSVSVRPRLSAPWRGIPFLNKLFAVRRGRCRFRVHRRPYKFSRHTGGMSLALLTDITHGKRARMDRETLRSLRDRLQEGRLAALRGVSDAPPNMNAEDRPPELEEHAQRERESLVKKNVEESENRRIASIDAALERMDAAFARAAVPKSPMSACALNRPRCCAPTVRAHSNRPQRNRSPRTSQKSFRTRVACRRI